MAEPFATRVSVEEARRLLVDIGSKHALAHESVALEFAHGRVLANDAIAPHDVPGFANSAMDGFAVRGADLPTQADKAFALAGEILAGGRDAPSVAPDTCVRVTTGAPLPRGADTIVMKENTRSEGDAIWIAPGTAPRAHVRPAGEDYRAGEIALRRGARLTPAALGALASFGFAQVDVVRRPRAVLLTTGDELVAPGQVLGFGQIHDSNRYSLGAVLQCLGVELLRHERVRDDPALLHSALLRAAADADLVFSSGGVSAGEADFMPRLIAQIGKIHLWKVRMRPGMPFLCGQIDRALVFALPGNPVSGIATLLALVRPALAAMIGSAPSAPLRARLATAIHKHHPRAEFQRAQLVTDAAGVLRAMPLERQGSGMLRGVVDADALIVLAEETQDFAAESVVEVLPLPWWPPV